MSQGSDDHQTTKVLGDEQMAPRRKCLVRCRWLCLVLLVLSFCTISSAAVQKDVRSDLTKVTAAVPREFPPHYNVDKNGKPTGFAIEVMQRLAVLAGLKVTYLIENSWDDVAEAVRDGRADLIPNIGITPQREAWLDYTAPVETFPISIFVRRHTYEISGVDDLAGRKVAAVKFNIGVNLLKERGGINLVVFDDHREAVLALLSGQVDALVYPAPVVMKMVRDAGIEDRIKIVGKPLAEIKRAVGVHKGNPALLERLNQAVDRFVGTADNQKIYVKWFGEPQPFWTMGRVALVMGVLLFAALAAMATWRYWSIVKLNRRLTDSIAKRERAEETLKQEKAFTENALNTVTDLFFVFDLEGTILRWNKAVSQVTGYSDDEISSMRVTDFCLEEELPVVTEAIQAVLTDGHAIVEAILFTKNGKHIPHEFKGALFNGAQGSTAVICAVGRDLTERKEAEEKHLEAIAKAEEERQKTESIIAAIGDGISIQDTDFRVVYQNKINEDLIGRHIGEYCYMAYEGKAEPCEGCPVAMSYRDGKVHTAERSGITDNGPVYVEITASPVRNAKGEIIAGIEVVRDVTEGKKTREALIESEKKYRNLVDNASVGIFKTNLRGEIAYVNDALIKMLQFGSAEELMGGGAPTKYKSPKDRDVFLQELKEKGRIDNFETELLTATGGSRNVLISATFDGNFLSGMIMDITERRKLETQLLQAQKMEAVGRLAGGVAHDFNNMMTSVIGNADLALMELGEDDPLRGDLMEIRKAGERASALTRQLLAFSRRQVLEPEVLDLNAVIKETEKMLQRVVEENVELQTILIPELGRVEIDPTQIVQVIMNLAVNARDAMPQGGKLTIETANTALDEAYARGHGIEIKPGPYVMLVVSDTGMGMDEETRSQIFEPFFTTKEKGKGTGLGLATVYGIVKQSGGFIWVYSEPGQGTTFKIYFPRAEAEGESVPKKRVPTEGLAGTGTILLVEDNESVRNLARRVLERYGYRVLEAKNGEEGLQVSEQHEGGIDLMLTDVIMPGMSGRELAEKLRSERTKMKVLYMSGYMDNAIVHHGVLEPGTKFIHKPFTPDGLARKVQEVLEED